MVSRAVIGPHRPDSVRRINSVAGAPHAGVSDFVTLGPKTKTFIPIANTVRATNCVEVDDTIFRPFFYLPRSPPVSFVFATPDALAAAAGDLAGIQSAVAAASNAIQAAQKAARQAADVAEANFQAVTTTAVKATQGATKSKRAA